MSKINITTTYKKMLSDVFTPVGIYLRIRDRFRDTVLLESTDFHAGQNSYSLLGINAIAGMEISSLERIETKFPKEEAGHQAIRPEDSVPELLWGFMQRFEVNAVADKAAKLAQGLFGYTTFDAEQFFEPIRFKQTDSIPLMRYRLDRKSVV